MYNLKLPESKNFIHHTAIIDPSVVLGKGNYIGPYCVIEKGVSIGDGNRFEAYCSIGTPPEHQNFWNGSEYGVEIGNGCIIREYVTVNAGTSRNTSIGNGVHLLHACYVAHDCFVSDRVTLSGNAAIAGHCDILEGANIGLNVSVHQYSIIGHYSMIGMGAVVTKTSIIEPVKTYVGSPARYLKVNQYAIEKHALSLKDIHMFNDEFVARRAAKKDSQRGLKHVERK